MPARETFFGGALVLAAILWNIGMEPGTRPKAGPAETRVKNGAVKASNESV